jgi:hypothetical protein
MTNTPTQRGLFATIAKNLNAFLGSFFVSSTSKEFQRLKNFIAS